MIFVTTVASKESAQKISAQLIEEKLVACAQISAPVESVFRWEGQIQTEQEFQIWLKTTEALAEPLTKRIQEIHPYEVPEILGLPVKTGLKAYLDWIAEETTSVR